MAQHSQSIMPATFAAVNATPNNEFDYVFCRDFVWQQFPTIRLQGKVSEINSLMERVNQDFTVRAASNEDRLSALHALTISLETTTQAAAVTFQDLLNTLKSPAYRNLAQTTVRSASISNDHRRNLFQRLTAEEDLPLTAILILLNLLGKFSGKVYEVGVLTFKGIIQNVPTFRVQLHAANPDRVPNTIVWIAKDCHCTDGNASSTQWSGIALVPVGGATATASTQSLTRKRDSLPTFDLDFSAENLIDLENFDLNAFLASFDGQGGGDPSDNDDIGQDGLLSSYKRGGKWRRRTPGAAMKDTQLPIELLSDVTLEELIIYYPEHVFHWPGLALIALHTTIRSKVKGDTGFKAIADLVNNSRGLQNGEDDQRLAVTRLSVRGWLMDAARTILGPHYGPKEDDHLKALYAAIAADPTVNNVAEFMQKHLWDIPLEEEMDGLRPQWPLLRVGQGVVNHPQYGHLKDRIFCSLNGIQFAAPAPPLNQVHPMILKLNDFTRSESDLLQATAAGLTKAVTHKLPRDRYPAHISQDDMIGKYWPDLYGEPLLWTLLDYTMADIAKRVSEEVYRTYSKTRAQFETTMRQRKRTALKDRAHRLGRPLKEILQEYETELTEWGTRKGRRDRLPNGLRAQQIKERRRLREAERGSRQFQHISRKKRKRAESPSDADARKHSEADHRPRLPSLPALSPPLPGEGWEFPPESEFKIKSKPGRYIAVQKPQPVQAQAPAPAPAPALVAVMQPVALAAVKENTPPPVNSPSGTRMRFSFSYHAEDDEGEGQDADADGELDEESFALLAQYVNGS